MLYGLDDLRMRRQFVAQDGEDEAHKLREHKRLDALIAYCEASQCRRQTLLAYFDEQVSPCGNCDTCIDPPRMVEGTQDAKLLLSAVAGTGQMFGAAHLIDVLRGGDTAKVRERGHDRLAAYGAGAEHPKEYWQAFIRQAVAGAYLTINIQKYGALQITRRGAAVADGREPFYLREAGPLPAARKKAATPKAARAAAAAGLDGAGETLLVRLKALRLELARARQVPAYVVFPDATLIEMASARPDSLSALAQINGVGPKKLADFGAAFLEALGQAE
jgi:ATP-dependent DNA helicase RecQ